MHQCWLTRIKADDGVVYCSPKTSLSSGRPCQEFTATGEVISDQPYSSDMSHGFVPFRKDVHFYEAQAVSVHTLMNTFELTKDKNWGYQLRFGLLKLSEQDFLSIRSAMMNKNC